MHLCSSRDSFVLFKAGLNSLNGQCVYVKITNTAVGESASTTGIDKNMIITVSIYLSNDMITKGYFYHH